MAYNSLNSCPALPPFWDQHKCRAYICHENYLVHLLYVPFQDTWKECERTIIEDHTSAANLTKGWVFPLVSEGHRSSKAIYSTPSGLRTILSTKSGKNTNSTCIQLTKGMAFSKTFINHQSQVNYIRLRFIKANFVNSCFLNISTKLCTHVTGAFTCEGSHNSSRSSNICIQARFCKICYVKLKAKMLDDTSSQAGIIPNVTRMKCRLHPPMI